MNLGIAVRILSFMEGNELRVGKAGDRHRWQAELVIMPHIETRTGRGRD